MYLSFYGAAGEVTGACTLLESGKTKILVDCGMFQGSEFNASRNHEEFSFDPKVLSAVVVTHAHLDHVGRLPLLVKAGYCGFFYATPATIDLAQLIMEDAVEVMHDNNRRNGEPILYDLSDVNEVVQQFKAVDYYETFYLDEIKKDVFIKFYDAGHIFGSTFVEVNVKNKKIIFSGDIGNINAPILRDTDNLPGGIHTLICESTYGDRAHEASFNPFKVIEQIVVDSVKRGGVLMIPAFSLERTQELLYRLNDFIDRRHGLPRVPIFLDSPLAIKAMSVFKRYPQYYDAAAKSLMAEGDDFFNFAGLTLCETREESLRINKTPGPKIIIAGAGMMNGGRIQHHAIRYLSYRDNTLLIIGYQAEGTLGRKILNGESPVKIFGETIPVKCAVKAVGSLSAHGDQYKLLNWLKSAPDLPEKIILNHGELHASTALLKQIKNGLGCDGEIAKEGRKIRI